VGSRLIYVAETTRRGAAPDATVCTGTNFSSSTFASLCSHDPDIHPSIKYVFSLIQQQLQLVKSFRALARGVMAAAAAAAGNGAVLEEGVGTCDRRLPLQKRGLLRLKTCNSGKRSATAQTAAKRIIAEPAHVSRCELLVNVEWHACSSWTQLGIVKGMAVQCPRQLAGRG
jgi:hypothetical protein